MPRAKQKCRQGGCSLGTFRDGWCKSHQKRKSWDRVSPRNQNRPTDINSRRAKALARDGFQCQTCGSRTDLEVDHKQSIAKGGTWELDNLWTLCKECHKGKTKELG